MAEPLKFRPHVSARDPAREELEALLQTLHESGNLRLAIGLFGKFPEVLRILLDQLGGTSGRNAIGNLTVLAASLGKLSTAPLERFSTALGEGLDRAYESAPLEPPGLLRLLSRLGQADVRRGLHAAIVMLQTLGEFLRTETEAKPSRELSPAKARVAP
jgi:uncharacterized protein YjgD (DUF1641 family)